MPSPASRVGRLPSNPEDHRSGAARDSLAFATSRRRRRTAAILWTTNVITFALWYWRLDAGGPNERARQRGARSRAFLFPQMMYVSDPLPDDVSAEWRRLFVDYLFLAFNTSTEFSPTDVPVLSRWAKVLTMMQALISFMTVVLLVARAINTI